jgi:hypothetical protein
VRRYPRDGESIKFETCPGGGGRMGTNASGEIPRGKDEEFMLKWFVDNLR